MDSLKTYDASCASLSVSGLYQEMSESSHNIVRILDTFLGVLTDQPEHNQKVRVVMALASLAHSRNDHTNNIQSLIGLYLYSLNTPKRAIMSLNKLGICVSDSTIARNLEAAARAARIRLKGIARKGKAFISVFDNLTFMAKVRDTRLDNQSEFMTWTAGYVLIPPASRSPPAFKQLIDLNRNKISDLGMLTFLPSSEDHRNLNAACRAIIGEILLEFCKFADVTIKDKPPCELPTVFRIDRREPPEVFPLPTYDFNEAICNDMIQILYAIQDDTGLSKRQCLDDLYLYSGDLMTVEGMRYIARPSGANLDKRDFDNRNVRITKGCGTLRRPQECSIYSWPLWRCFTRSISGSPTRSVHSLLGWIFFRGMSGSSGVTTMPPMFKITTRVSTSLKCSSTAT
jgi:hypothetical protein